MSAFSGLRQIADIVHPRTFKALKNAGTLSAMSPVAISGALPWLIGRGPSLGLMSQMNSVALGNKVALHDRKGTVTFRELDRTANRVVAALVRVGVEPGQPVALLLRNGREMAAAILGCQKVGYTACPMNTWAQAKELDATLRNAAPSVLIYDTRHAEQVRAAAPEGIVLIAVGDAEDATDGSQMWDDFLDGATHLPPLPFALHRGAPKIIIHTSGTTGTPKGAQRDASSSGLGRMAEVLSVVPFHRTDVIYCPAPMFHSFGLLVFTMATVLGATLVMAERFDPQSSLDDIESSGATAAAFVPVMIKRITQLDGGSRAGFDNSRLRAVMASGSAMSPDLRKAASEVFGPVLYDLYGSTEAGWVAIATPDDMAEEPRSVGRPVPGTEIKLFSDGEPVPVGEIGEIHVRSEMVFEGYTSGDNRPFIDGHISIGDLGRIDERGYLFIEGRADDMVVVGGENVYPIEVEEAIEAIEGVKEVAVMGAEDPEFGHVLVAYVAGSVTENDVLEHCRASLASYKVPRRVTLMSELPRTATGKILKRDLQ